MKDYYSHTRKTINRYNQIVEKMGNVNEDTTDDEDEFIMNFCLHLAHALIKDTGGGQIAREELSKVADIINDVVI